MPFCITIVLDGVGVGYQPDASDYGDVGANTLAHVVEQQRPNLPNLQRAGLGNIITLPGIPPTDSPGASWGKMMEKSAGKDSTTGHWELGGINLEKPFPTYPNGFPEALIQRFKEVTSSEGILGNKAASGTEIIDQLGEQHIATGFPIVYTSADSVFQIAAHTDIIPLMPLYEMCDLTRRHVCVDDHGVGRVIARPFIGTPGNFSRVSKDRKDYSYLPVVDPLQTILQNNGIETISIGKVADLFGGVGFDKSFKTASNADGIARTISALHNHSGEKTYVWVNLVDFDQEYGHRNDPAGFATALEEFDQELPSILAALPEGSRMLLTADHGNDPTFPGTDHTREYVPLLLFGDAVCTDLGLRDSFADHASSVLDYFGISDHKIPGTSFLTNPRG